MWSSETRVKRLLLAVAVFAALTALWCLRSPRVSPSLDVRPSAAARATLESALPSIDPPTGQGLPAADARHELEVSTPSAPPPATTENDALVLEVVSEDGGPLVRMQTIATRDETVLAWNKTDEHGLARLVPFDGPAECLVRYNGDVIHRQRIEAGRGRQRLVVPDRLSVAGTVLVDGVAAHEPVGLKLDPTADSSFPDSTPLFVRERLDGPGGGQSARFETQSDAEGRFRFRWLDESWHGRLRPDQKNFVIEGASATSDDDEEIVLDRPQEDLVVRLTRRPAITGRLVLQGQPVPQANWSAKEESLLYDENKKREKLVGGWGLRGLSDADGRFRITLSSLPGTVDAALSFVKGGVGARTLELKGLDPARERELGDVELMPARDIAFVVHDSAGASVERAFAVAQSALNTRSAPTDAEGRGLVHSFEGDTTVFTVSAVRFTAQEMRLPLEPSQPIEVVLAHVPSLDIRISDAGEHPLPGVAVKLEAHERLFSTESGDGPDAAQVELGASPLFEGGHSLLFTADPPGYVLLTGLTPGVSFELSIVDLYGTLLSGPETLSLAPGEWRAIVRRLNVMPRSLRVELRDQEGNPLVDVNAWAGANGSSRWVPFSSGQLWVADVYAPKIELEIDAHGFEHMSTELDVPEDGETLRLELRRK